MPKKPNNVKVKKQKNKYQTHFYRLLKCTNNKGLDFCHNTFYDLRKMSDVEDSIMHAIKV